MTIDTFHRSEGPFFIRWVLLPIIRPALDDMDRAETLVKSEGDLEYTIVLPPGLNNGGVTGERNKKDFTHPVLTLSFAESPFKTASGEYFVKGGNSAISRADVARFILDTAEKGAHKNEVVAMCI